jgi:hypothetical protein
MVEFSKKANYPLLLIYGGKSGQIEHWIPE